MVKIVLRERESAQEAVRRLRKILDRSGLKRELRRRERYEKPSAVKRQAKNRAIRRTKAQARAVTSSVVWDDSSLFVARNSFRVLCLFSQTE